MNEGLYHIILYVLEEKLLYNEEKGWKNTIAKQGAKECAEHWLEIYDLK